ncbi:hypothetical protein EJ06DRAFT_530694 [Trichodelitschia bisporula]|uniref:Uncharacterized protein n=1 Tax=Trichodelitschia bisporula TaxID=703511 RepID=A0A6G1HV80_9PEZI|nr:hypothetical protein EJ06DRAFT_530694 [Trichodelitschia bisporula]
MFVLHLFPSGKQTGDPGPNQPLQTGNPSPATMQQCKASQRQFTCNINNNDDAEKYAVLATVWCRMKPPPRYGACRVEHVQFQAHEPAAPAR